MLNFIFWGVTLNCYAFTIYALALYSLSPYELQIKSKIKPLSLVGGIFTPYVMFIIGLIVFVLIVYCRFDVNKMDMIIQKMKDTK